MFRNTNQLAYNCLVTLPKNFLISSTSCTHSLSLQITDLNNECIDFTKWNRFEPNGKHIEGCIEIVAVNGTYGYNDITCNDSKCYACLVPTQQKIKIRGPVLSGVDSIYLSKVSGNKFEIRGQYKSKVVLKNHTWVVDEIMKVNGSNQLPPLGLKLWHIGGEKLPIKLKITQVN